MKKHSSILLLAGLALLASGAASCNKTESDVFEQSSSQRLTEYTESARALLTGAENGWRLEYYPGKSQSLGGYVYALDFTDEQVTARWELEPGESYTSYYKLTYDNGPVLSFDTNNHALHYFATPSSSEYEAKGGDFEFSIMSISEEEIVLKGKRSGNYCYLVPRESEADRDAEMQQIYDMSEKIKAATFSGTVLDKEFSGTVDLNSRALTFVLNEGTEEEEEIRMPFCYTSNGIRAYKAIDVYGATLRDFVYLEQNNLLTNGAITLKCAVPADYTDFGNFLGEFTLNYNNGSNSVKVKLTSNEDGSGFVMSGLNSNFSVNLHYDKAKGRLKWYSQQVGTNGSNCVFLCAWGRATGGTLTWSTSAGVSIYRDVNSETETYLFEDLGEYESVAADSFILWELTSSLTTVGEFTSWGTSRFPYLTSLTR